MMSDKPNLSSYKCVSGGLLLEGIDKLYYEHSVILSHMSHFF